MDWLTGYFKALKDQSPYINTAVSGICFLIIIFPIFLSADLLLKVSDIITFRKAYLPHLVIVFLLSTIFAGSHGIKKYVEKAHKKKKAAKERERKLILLNKLEELYKARNATEVSQEVCLHWANKVAPLLHFNEQYYANFINNSHKINLDLSSYTIVPAIKIMISQVELAIEELRNDLNIISEIPENTQPNA